jgi:hypothetical protein
VLAKGRSKDLALLKSGLRLSEGLGLSHTISYDIYVPCKTSLTSCEEGGLEGGVG